MKYYVVWKGANPGIYDNWADCKAQITGYPDARYKSFKTKSEATIAYREGYTFTKKATTTGAASRSSIIQNSISVDAACSGNPGDMEYRGVITSTGQELFKQGVFQEGTNNVGEFLAIVHGLAYLRKIGKHDLPIYTDSRTALAWVRKRKANTKLEMTNRNKDLFELIARGENWLKANTYNNPLIKWDTKSWGEIPADFGRK